MTWEYLSVWDARGRKISRRFAIEAAFIGVISRFGLIGAMAEAADQLAYLILGGCGMVGRNLVQYLISNNLARKIRVADKAMPMTSYFQSVVQRVLLLGFLVFVLLLMDLPSSFVVFRGKQQPSSARRVQRPSR